MYRSVGNTGGNSSLYKQERHHYRHSKHWHLAQMNKPRINKQSSSREKVSKVQTVFITICQSPGNQGRNLQQVSDQLNVSDCSHGEPQKTGTTGTHGNQRSTSVLCQQTFKQGISTTLPPQMEFVYIMMYIWDKMFKENQLSCVNANFFSNNSFSLKDKLLKLDIPVHK